MLSYQDGEVLENRWYVFGCPRPPDPSRDMDARHDVLTFRARHDSNIQVQQAVPGDADTFGDWVLSGTEAGRAASSGSKRDQSIG